MRSVTSLSFILAYTVSAMRVSAWPRTHETSSKGTLRSMSHCPAAFRKAWGESGSRFCETTTAGHPRCWGFRERDTKQCRPPRELEWVDDAKQLVAAPAL